MATVEASGWGLHKKSALRTVVPEDFKKKEEQVAWFVSFAERLHYPNDAGAINQFFHCCGGREIGGFGRMLSTFYDSLRSFGDKVKGSRQHYIDYMNKNFKAEEIKEMKRMALKKGILTQIRGVDGMSSIVATTTEYQDQLLAAECLREIGFKDVLRKKNSNSGNFVTTWVYVGDGTLL